MRKLLTTTAVAILCCIFAENTQAQAFQKGTKNLNVGLGLGYGIGLNASVDVGVHELISIGAIGGYNSRNYAFGDFRISSIGLGVRGAVHLGKFVNEAIGVDDNKFDPYVGVMAGYRMVRYNDSYSSFYSGNSSYIMGGGYAGTRYYFKEKLGVYAEIGWPYTSFGVTFKF